MEVICSQPLINYCITLCYIVLYCIVLYNYYCIVLGTAQKSLLGVPRFGQTWRWGVPIFGENLETKIQRKIVCI